MTTKPFSEIIGWTIVVFSIAIIFMAFYQPQTMAKIISAGLSPIQFLKLPSSEVTPTVDAKAQGALKTYSDALRSTSQNKNFYCLTKTPSIENLNEYGINIISSQGKSVISLTQKAGGGTQLLEQTPLDGVQVWTIDAAAFKECHLTDGTVCSTPPERLANPETNLRLTADEIGPVMMAMGSSGVAFFKQSNPLFGDWYTCQASNNGLSPKCFRAIDSKTSSNQGLRWCT